MNQYPNQIQGQVGPQKPTCMCGIPNQLGVYFFGIYLCTLNLFQLIWTIYITYYLGVAKKHEGGSMNGLG